MNIFITGEVGSGKSTFVKFLSNYLNKNYFNIIDLDVLAKKIIEEQGIILPSDKSSLFKNQNDLFFLEKQIWKHLSIPNNGKINVVEASTLFECPQLITEKDFIINIESDNSKNNVLSRDKQDRYSLIKMNQLSNTVKSLCSDITVKNNHELIDLERKAKYFAENLNYQQTKEFKSDLSFIEKEWLLNFPDLPKKFLFNLLKEYSRIDRFYHNQKHIIYLLDMFNKHIKEKIQHKLWKRAILLAIFYHDVKMKFIPKYPNEEESIQFMFNEFRSENILHKCLIGSRSYVTLAADMIYCTKNHSINDYISSSEHGKKYTQMFLDIDMSILSDTDNIDIYEQGIRKEWMNFSDQEYSEGRSKILSSFLNNDIYYSEIFKEKNNIAKDLIKNLITHVKETL